MTRDTKVGMILAGSFVILVGVVVATRMFRGEPADQSVAAVRDGSELQEEKGPPPAPKKKEGDKAPGLLPASLNVPATSTPPASMTPAPNPPKSSTPVPPPPPPPPGGDNPGLNLPPVSPTPPSLDPNDQKRTLEALARAAVDPPPVIPGKPVDLPPTLPPAAPEPKKTETPSPAGPPSVPAPVPTSPVAEPKAPEPKKETGGIGLPPLPSGPGSVPPPLPAGPGPETPKAKGADLPPPIAPPPTAIPAPPSPPAGTPKIELPAPDPAPAPPRNTSPKIQAPKATPGIDGPPPIPAPPAFGPENPEPMPPPAVVVPKTPDPTPPVIPAPPVGTPPLGSPPVGSTPPAPTPTPTPPVGVPPLGAAPQTNLPPVRSVDIEPYQVRAGDDSFQTVGRRVYGSDRYGRALQQFNQEHPLADQQVRQGAATLQPGQRIFLPPREILESKYGSLLNGAAPSPPAGTPTSGTPVSTPPVSLGTPPRRTVPTTPTTDEVKSYRVGGNGQYIIEIAQQTLGDGRRWAEIYRLNPSIRPEQVIPPGTELKIPAGPRRP